MQHLIDMANAFAYFVHNHLGSSLTVAVFAYDIIRRLVPSKDPAGFVQDVSKALKGISSLFSVLSGLGNEVAAFLDKICPVPQNIKAPDDSAK